MAVHEGSALCPVSCDSQVLPRQKARSHSGISRLPAVPKLTLPQYRFKIFRSKGAVLVLFWGFSAQFVLHFATHTPDRKTVLAFRDKTISPVLGFTMCLLLYPILGWLGDVKYGRYRVIKCGLWTMWVMSILLCLMSAILTYFSPLSSYHHLHHLKVKLKILLYVPIGLGLGGMLSNIVQFGTDQLVDASSGEITSFLRWFAWLWFLGGVLTGVSQSCFCFQYESVAYLIFPTLMTMSIAFDFIFNHWLVKEPPSSNPLVLILRVLCYAVKNKYPRQRSAFTYWEDKPYSRIDLAKDKYGGPFTTEQVEDVKTFFRIISVVLASTFFISMFLSAYPTYSKVMRHLADGHYVPLCGPHSFVANCFQRASIAYAGNLVLFVAIPFFEFFFYPFFVRYIRFSILQKASLGFISLVVSLAACTAIEFVANHQRPWEGLNMTCPLDGKVKIEPSLPLDYKWMALPYILNSVGQFLLLTSLGEFLCAQSPYSMKGFLFGVTFGLIGFFAILGYGIMKPLAIAARNKLSGGYGCMSWYLLMCSGFLLAILVLFFLVFKCYKKRMRDDSEHNEQIFAVNYYSQCQDSTE